MNRILFIAFILLMNSSFSFAQRSQGEAGGIGGKGGNGYDLEIFYTITSDYYFYDQRDCEKVIKTNKQLLPLICEELAFKDILRELTPAQSNFQYDCCRTPR